MTGHEKTGRPTAEMKTPPPLEDLAPDEEKSARVAGGYQTGGSGRGTTACANGEH
jgi:hypothetical protein